jgi:hypothetical protein
MRSIASRGPIRILADEPMARSLGKCYPSVLTTLSLDPLHGPITINVTSASSLMAEWPYAGRTYTKPPSFSEYLGATGLRHSLITPRIFHLTLNPSCVSIGALAEPKSAEDHW